ncbi:MAG: hypothetical protein EOM37_19565 [Proteobacteria bacterium]|nr:hypothetical protein [Pseudomonadota bacterium]
MKKKAYNLTLLVAIAATGIIQSSIASAAALTSSSGAEIVIDAVAAVAATGTSPAVPARPEFSFQPSPQVTVAGATATAAFSVAAAHDGVIGKDNGEAYAMTSEKSGLFVMKKPTADTDIAVGAAGLLIAGYELPDGTDYVTAE